MRKLSILLFFLFFIGISSLVAQQETSFNPTETQDYGLRWQNYADSLEQSWSGKKFMANLEKNKLSAIPLDFDTINFNKENAIHFQNAPALQSFLQELSNRKAALQLSYFLLAQQQSFILAELKKRDMPQVFLTLPVALSAMNNKAVGYTGAAGAWQLNYTLARKANLRVDSYVDERRDFAKATVAALDAIQTFYGIYQDWALASVAYFCGPANLNKAIRRSNNQTDFYGFQQALPVFGRDMIDFWAATYTLMPYMMPTDRVMAVNYDTIEVSKRLHFEQLEHFLGIEKAQLRDMNPKYKLDIVPAIHEVLHINLPHGYLEKFNSLEDSIYHYKDSLLFNIQRVVILPPPPKGRHWAQSKPESKPANSTLIYYTIKSGDNLGYIASWFNVRVSELEDWNNIYDPRKIRAGKKLKIYVPKSKASYYRKMDGMSASKKNKLNGNTTTLNRPKKQEPKASTLGNNFFYHTVKSGESPYLIAKKYPGVSAEDILRWNNIKNARNIRPGQKLKIKKP